MSRKLPGRSVGLRKMFSRQENWGAGIALFKRVPYAGRIVMSRKHLKGSKPSDADLYRNPMIGGSKGAAMAQVTADDLEEFAGENTIEGDIENDTNPQGGIDKAEVNDRKEAPRKDRASGSSTALQGRKTHEQQLRMLERKPDFPDQRQLDSELARAQGGSARSPRHRDARQSEFS